MSETETRTDRKERTRRALLDTALALTSESSLVALSLRQVAKEVGIVPTAFYRHFDSIEDLGLTLVGESFVSLRAMLQEVRRPEATSSTIEIADRSVDVLAEHVARHQAHFAFIARERAAGPAAVRSAIRHEIQLIERELAADLARLPAAHAYSSADLQTLSSLIVGAMVDTAEQLVGARADQQQRLVTEARTQLRMVLIGALQWRSKRS